jgi:hypothetical protein
MWKSEELVMAECDLHVRTSPHYFYLPSDLSCGEKKLLRTLTIAIVISGFMESRMSPDGQACQLPIGTNWSVSDSAQSLDEQLLRMSGVLSEVLLAQGG